MVTCNTAGSCPFLINIFHLSVSHQSMLTEDLLCFRPRAKRSQSTEIRNVRLLCQKGSQGKLILLGSQYGHQSPGHLVTMQALVQWVGRLQWLRYCISEELLGVWSLLVHGPLRKRKVGGHLRAEGE
jgi:hypothetical protein